jgi:hypothetical protein
MRYQLVLRFPGDAFDEFDEIVALETALAECLGELGMLENCDVGSDECRIALLTADPVRAFIVAVYRPIGGKDYTVLWPSDSATEMPGA